MPRPLNDGPPAEPPLLAHLREIEAGERFSFHMPGHKGGAGAPALGRALFGEALYAADVSEMGGFDYLHHPESALLEAQRRAAALLGADRSWFLVNGATVGNLAAICAAVAEGESLLVARGSHRSVYAALALSGAFPRYLAPVADDELDGLFAIDPGELAAELATHPEIRAVHLTSPSYYGFALDLGALVPVVHGAGVPLIVDEAHGSHFAFHPAFPTPALVAGADVVVQSPHKTLGSLTQSSLLHLRGGRVDAERIDALLQMLQSSSPSAILLVSLELALEEMARHGHRRWGEALDLAARVRAELDAAGLRCYGDEILGGSGVAAYDPTKLVVDVADRRLSAPEAARWLADRRAIRPEFTDLRRLVFSLTVADDAASAEDLVASLVALADEAPLAPSGARLTAVWPQAVPERALSVREAIMGAARATHEVPLEAAVGAVSAEMVVPYPPGIPLLVPGEIVDDAVVATIAQLRAQRVRIVGMAAPTTLRCLKR